ncbi:hypothetical protein BP5796_05757 [Coleophoma crateriformis]|uniref:Uncharacterized protein n=1 Tax=Coleophoma crateriformis TaxID=565419 RepID=A0A3D8RV76_9HELO|nr:hypothetical protein BP5796_05757 [Coleophoma crateriformis]
MAALHSALTALAATAWLTEAMLLDGGFPRALAGFGGRAAENDDAQARRPGERPAEGSNNTRGHDKVVLVSCGGGGDAPAPGHARCQKPDARSSGREVISAREESNTNNTSWRHQAARRAPRAAALYDTVMMWDAKQPDVQLHGQPAEFEAIYRTGALQPVPACHLQTTTRRLGTGLDQDPVGTSNLCSPDTTCLCSNTTLQYSLSTCIQGDCSFTDQLKVAELNNELCINQHIENQGAPVVWVGVGMGIATLLCVALRLTSRHLIAQEFWLDDWAMLGAAIIYCGIIVTDVLDHKLGLGRHLWKVEIANIIPLTKVFLSSELLYLAVLVFTKISILLFYLRVFTRTWFRTSVKLMIAFVALWGVAFILVAIFQCRPIHGAWDKTVPAVCINVQSLAYSAAAIGIAQDLLILILPLPELQSLQMRLEKKVHTLALFSIGSFACITSIVRLRFLITFGNSKDPTWDNVTPAIWSLIEINVAMICACLPAIRVIVVHWIPSLGFESIASATPSNSKSNASSSNPGTQHPSRLDTLEEGHELSNTVPSKQPKFSIYRSVTSRSETGSEDDLMDYSTPADAVRCVDIEAVHHGSEKA